MVMGRIVAPYGIKGWVKVHTYSDEKATLLGYAAWWLRPRAGLAVADDGEQRGRDWREYAITAAREHGATLVAQLSGIGDREAAAALKGFDVGVPRATLPAREENELYYSDLVGLEVVNRQGISLGKVAQVQDFGAHPVLCITDRVAAVERMIPFVAAYVDAVDVAAGRIDVDWHLDY